METEIEIVYSDKHVCVCKKPRGILSEGEGQGCLPQLLSEQLAAKGQAVRVFPVHRLDRETEGLMAYALTQQAAAELSRQITAGEFKKEYIAELCGAPDSPEGELTDLLFYDRGRGKAFVVKRERKGVKEARLDYRVLDSDGKYTRVRVRLYTGRTHQIRVQFASRGLPLRGDRRYGAPAGTGELALRSCYLSFKHPTTGERLEFGEQDGELDVV